MAGALKNKSSDAGITEEAVVGKDAAIASIKKLITSTADKPYSLSIKMKEDTLKIFGYKNVTDIQASDFFVHRRGTDCEVGFIYSFATEVCRKSSLPTSDNNIITALTKPERQKKLSDSRFESAISTFSAIRDAGMNVNQSQKLTSDRTNLDFAKKDYEQEFKVAVKLAELIEAHQSKKAAIRSVLETTDTRCVVKTCEEYYSTIERGIAYGWQKTEYLSKNKLTQLTDNLKRGVDPHELLDKSISEISAICKDRSMGINLIEVWIKREIADYNKSIKDDRKRVESPIDVSSWEEGLAKEQVEKQAVEYKDKLDKDIKVHSLLEDALKILQKMGSSNEPNKP